ncbi:hypothetical protein [Micromonospora sp. NPDC050495]|uniref:hypothetical protein n=1 Tax=Micromonospora sp. NPDC050495 TaxID=3154936 RepID=UPI0033CE5E8A
MPAPVTPAEKRTPLLSVLFWVGVGCAPLAALILLVADGNGPLRFGAVLAMLAVVLIGLSIALRADGGVAAVGVDELRDELEQLRRELRAEVVAAAQRGNQALDQVRRTEESVNALRRRLDAAAAGIAAAPGRTASPAEEPPGGRARVPAADGYGGQPAPEPAPEPAAGRRQAAVDDGPARRAQPGTRYGGDRAGADRPQAGVYGAPRAPEPDGRSEPGPRPVGVVHHTETVHVTTRHTIVDGGADSGTRYGGYPGRWSAAPEERGFPGAESEERPWSGYRDTGEERAGSGGAWPEPGAGRDHRARGDQGGARDDRDRPGPATAWDDRPPAGPGGSRDGAVGGPVREHPWARAGGAGGPGPEGDRSWSAARAGEDDPRSWAAAPAGPDDDRSWAPGRTAATDDRPAGRAGRRNEIEPSGAREEAGWDDRGWADQHGEPGWADQRDEAGWAGARDGRAEPDWPAAGRDGRDRPAAGQDGRHWPAPGRDERDWTASGRDERDWTASGRDERDRAGQGAEWSQPGGTGWSSPEPSGRAADDDPDGAYWSELRAGNRWASVRDDAHGREVQVGERRAAVHADGGGTEFRVEDRWAAVREPRRDSGGYGGHPDATSGWSDAGQAALPASGVPVPEEWRPPAQRSGQPEWRQAEPEPVRYAADERYGYPPRDEVPRAGGTRGADRWR